MTTSLGYSLFEQNNNINEQPIINNHEQRRKNKTLKNRNNHESSSEKVESMLKHLNISNDDDDEDGLADFNPPSKPISSGVERTKNSISTFENFDNVVNSNDVSNDDDDNEISTEAFQEATPKYGQQYYNQYVPYYTNASNTQESSNNPEIMEKLNYLVHLIENNNDEKINSITEELVLYCFLGVFIIFVVDSFAKVGKYVR